jgi:hypothetical protein
MTTTTAIEIRSNPDESIDEIIAHGCTLHIERMSDSEWWMEIGAADGSYRHFWIGAKNGRSYVDLRLTETIAAPTPAAGVAPSPRERIECPVCAARRAARAKKSPP